MRRLLPFLVLSMTATAYAGQPAIERGRELFLRTWVAYDARVANGGDGLGPMYNASSCAACHNAGGVGGAGTKERNVRLVKAGKDGDFVVDHRASTLSARPLNPSGGTRVERNTPALFGAGAIDSIPDQALVDLAAAQTGDISGRVPRTTDGRVARFGWKGHTANLDDFVSTACANELGLTTDAHPQGRPPEGDLTERLALMQEALKQRGGSGDLVTSPKRDLSTKDVAALTDFVRALPAPAQLKDQPGRDTALGLFASVGCVGCHVQKIGSVDAIYADLLLHDMGNSLADGAGAYQTRGNEQKIVAEIKAGDTTVAPVLAAEWRTPPLWGVRDSAPYLHDGRAVTLDDAIRAHGGEAAAATTKYNALSITEQQQLISFLESLVAPTGA